MAEAVDPLEVQHLVLALVEQGFETQRQTHHLVGGGFGDSALDVAARADARRKAAGRQADFAPRHGVEHRHPGVVKRGVLAVQLGAHAAHLADGLLVAAVEQGHAVAHQFGMPDELADDAVGLGAVVFVVPGATGRGHHGDVFEVLELLQAQAVTTAGIELAFELHRAGAEAVVAARQEQRRGARDAHRQLV